MAEPLGNSFLASNEAFAVYMHFPNARIEDVYTDDLLMQIALTDLKMLLHELSSTD